MQKRVTRSARDDQLIIDDTAEGLLLRPAVKIPIELYTDERIREFTSDKEAVGKLLKRQPEDR